MPKVWEKDGYRFLVYYNDHTPSHVHVKKAGREVVINLGDENAKPEIRERRGMEPHEAVRVFRMACKKRDYLQARWSAIQCQT